MDSSLFAALGGILVVLVLIVIAIAVLIIVSLWKIFVKAGEAGWKAIIPYYNSFIQFKLFWNTTIFWVYLAVSLVYSFTNGKSGFLGVVGVLTGLATLVLTVMLCYYMAKSFGKGVGFTVGLCLLPVVFFPILAFGDAQYIGNGSQSGNGPVNPTPYA